MPSSAPRPPTAAGPTSRAGPYRPTSPENKLHQRPQVVVRLGIHLGSGRDRSEACESSKHPPLFPGASAQVSANVSNNSVHLLAPRPQTDPKTHPKITTGNADLVLVSCWTRTRLGPRRGSSTYAGRGSSTLAGGGSLIAQAGRGPRVFVCGGGIPCVTQ
jgi:hypothetical protein